MAMPHPEPRSPTTGSQPKMEKLPQTSETYNKMFADGGDQGVFDLPTSSFSSTNAPSNFVIRNLAELRYSCSPRIVGGQTC